MEGIEKVKSGDFNDMLQEELKDGSLLITLCKRGEGKIYRFTVKNLYQANEKVLKEEVIEREL